MRQILQQLKNIFFNSSRIQRKKIEKSQTGSTIIELIFAVMIVGLIITAVANAVTHSIKNTGEARFKQVATTLGQEVMEYIRQEKNRVGIINLDTPLPGGDYCFVDVTSPIAGQCTNLDVISMAGADFQREVSIVYSGNKTPITDPYRMTVTVVVSWTDGATVREVELIQEFERADN